MSMKLSDPNTERRVLNDVTVNGKRIVATYEFRTFGVPQYFLWINGHMDGESENHKPDIRLRWAQAVDEAREKSNG